MASSIPPPPPPPPLPSIVQLTPKTLAPSQRPPANRNGVGSVRPTENPSNRSLLANIHPETLQHAAKHLRKTKHSESLFTPQSEQLLERPPELSSGGYRPNFEKHDQLELNQTGATIYASSLGSDSSLPKYNGKLDSNPLSKSLQTSSPAPAPVTAPTTTPSRWTTPYGQPLFYSKPLNVNNSSTVTNNNNNNNYSTYSSSSSTTYYPPPSQQQQQQQQPQVTGYSYSYSSNANSNGTPTSAPPDYPPPPPPPATITPTKVDPVNLQQPSSNFYSSYSSSTTTHTAPPQQPSYNTGTNNSSPYISNPQSYIHEFATKTPVAQIDPTLSSNAQVSATPPRQKPYSFVEELRDSTLTDRQKYANQFQRTNLPERLPPQAVAHIYQETTADTERQLSQRRQQQQQQQQQQSPFQSSKIDEVDELIKTMEWRMQTGNTNDICSKCQKEIVGDTPGVTALGKPYHVTCFTCDQCQKQLAGCSFYSVDGKNLCQVDYMNSLDKCDKCATPITQKILRAMGKAFHPECFACPSCTKSLDGIPFTVDPQGTPYCLDCYHDRFSPRCAVCLKAIVPQAGETEVARIVAMDRSYHLACYKCEDCGLQLNSKIEGQGCYPLESHLFCKNCNLKRLKAMK